MSNVGCALRTWHGTQREMSNRIDTIHALSTGNGKKSRDRGGVRRKLHVPKVCEIPREEWGYLAFSQAGEGRRQPIKCHDWKLKGYRGDTKGLKLRKVKIKGLRQELAKRVKKRVQGS